jgi:hypothetical protein
MIALHERTLPVGRRMDKERESYPMSAYTKNPLALMQPHFLERVFYVKEEANICINVWEE